MVLRLWVKVERGISRVADVTPVFAVSGRAKEQSVVVPTVGLASLAGKQQEALFIERNRLAIDIAVALHLPVGNVAPIILIVIAQITIQVDVGAVGHRNFFVGISRCHKNVVGSI